MTTSGSGGQQPIVDAPASASRSRTVASASATQRDRRRGGWVTLWGVGGVLALLLRAESRLVPVALEPFDTGELDAAARATYVAWAVFNAYFEGYRAFHRAFCPRVVARAFHLEHHGSALHRALAPLYCMSLLHANRSGKRVAWLTVGLVTLAVAVVSQAPQPWRGIVDGGVALALALGCLSLCWHALALLRYGEAPLLDLQLPCSQEMRTSGSSASESGASDHAAVSQVRGRPPAAAPRSTDRP